MALHERALLMHLKVSEWSARKYDDNATREVENNHGVVNVGRFNKILIPREKLTKIGSAVTALREFHLKNTLPWKDNGERLLPAVHYTDYMAEVTKLTGDFQSAVDEFVKNYPAYKEEARRNLGDLFNEWDYPSEAEVARKFSVSTHPEKVADTDFRVALGDEDLARIKTAAELDVQRRLEEAQRDSWKRVREQLELMRDRLTGTREVKKADGTTEVKDAKIYNSLFENMEELVTILPKLNITDDPHLSAVCEQMKELVVNPDDIRKDKGLKEEKARKIEGIMDQFKDFLN